MTHLTDSLEMPKIFLGLGANSSVMFADAEGPKLITLSKTNGEATARDIGTGWGSLLEGASDENGGVVLCGETINGFVVGRLGPRGEPIWRREVPDAQVKEPSRRYMLDGSVAISADGRTTFAAAYVGDPHVGGQPLRAQDWDRAGLFVSLHAPAGEIAGLSVLDHPGWWRPDVKLNPKGALVVLRSQHSGEDTLVDFRDRSGRLHWQRELQEVKVDSWYYSDGEYLFTANRCWRSDPGAERVDADVKPCLMKLSSTGLVERIRDDLCLGHNGRASIRSVSASEVVLSLVCGNAATDFHSESIAILSRSGPTKSKVDMRDGSVFVVDSQTAALLQPIVHVHWTSVPTAVPERTRVRREIEVRYAAFACTVGNDRGHR